MTEKDFRHADLNEIIGKLKVGMSFTTDYNGKFIEALCLDISDKGKTVMLFPEIQESFDEAGSTSWKESSIRRKINSNVFVCKLDEDFIDHTVVKEIHTRDYTTYDRFWLLSHEEIGSDVSYCKPNDSQKCLGYFEGRRKTRMFNPLLYSLYDYTWWLRSVCKGYDGIVGCADSSNGDVCCHSTYNNNVVLPVCLIRQI